MGEFTWGSKRSYGQTVLEGKCGLYEIEALQTSEDCGLGSCIEFDGVEIYTSHGALGKDRAEEFVRTHHAAFDPEDRYVPWCLFEPDEWEFGWEHETRFNDGLWWKLIGPSITWSWCERSGDRHSQVYTSSWRSIVEATMQEAEGIARECAKSRLDEARQTVRAGDYAGRPRVFTNPLSIRSVLRGPMDKSPVTHVLKNGVLTLWDRTSPKSTGCYVDKSSVVLKKRDWLPSMTSRT